jgi:hypothetical protein
MRQTGKYYWAKKVANYIPEVVYINLYDLIYRSQYDGHYHYSDFYWISDEPIEEPKIPLKLKDDSYYVIEVPGVEKKIVSHWSGRYGSFFAKGFGYNKDKVKVIAGPFTIDELANLKPIQS